MQLREDMDVVKAATVYTVIMQSKSPLMVSGKQVLTNYATQVRALGPQHQLGVPSNHLGYHLLKELVLLEGISDTTEMQTVIAEADRDGPVAIQRHISSLKIKKMWDTNRVRLEIGIHSDCAEEMVAALVHAGGDHRRGLPPKGAIQRKMQMIIDAAKQRGQ